MFPYRFTPAKVDETVDNNDEDSINDFVPSRSVQVLLHSFTGKVDLNDNSTILINTSTDSNQDQNSANKNSVNESAESSSILIDTFVESFTAENSASFFKNAKNSTKVCQSGNDSTVNDHKSADSTKMVQGSMDESETINNPCKTLATYFDKFSKRHDKFSKQRHDKSDADKSNFSSSGDGDSDNESGMIF